MASTSSSAVPRPSTDDDRATLLAPPARDDDAESNTSSIRVNRRYRNRRSSNIEDDDFDRRSIIDILKQPRLLTTLEQGLVIFAIILLCLAAIFGGLALGLKHKVDEGNDDDGRGGDTAPIYRTTTLTTTQTQIQTTTVAAPGPPAPTGLPPQDPPSKNKEVCLTSTCVQISAAILDSIDESVDPCEDFYQFANGNWLAAHPIPPEKGLYGAAQWIDQRNKDLLLRILGTPIDELLDRPALASTGETGPDEKEEEREADRKNLVDLHTFYSSCMDEDALDRRGAEPLLEVVREVIAAWHGSPEAVNDAAALKKQDRIKRLTDTLALLHARGIDALFSSFTQGDYRTAPDSMRLWLSQGGIGLPNPEYYADKAVEKVYTEVIRSALSSVYSQLESGSHSLNDGEDATSKKKKGKKGKKGGKGKKKHPGPDPPTRDFSSIFDFETQLSSVFVDSVTLEDPVLAYNAYNISELQQSLAPFIHWTDYFSSFSPRAFPHPVIVDAPAFIGNLSKILDKTSDDTLEVYFVWKAVQSLASLIGPRERARKEVTQLHNYLSGIDEGVRGRREDVCLQSLLDNYGFLMGRYYVQQAFNGDAKEYAETIIKSAIQAFKDRLPELDWLDDVSRAGAEEKASAIGIKIGYPTASPDTRSAVALRRFYAGVPSPAKGKYFEAVMNVRTQEERRKWLGVGKTREGWEMVPTEVNAYYQPQANEMVFPAGILQAPYFSKDYPEYLGFGSMASLAGHELTHAFDSAGRQFDKTGKLTDWWTNDTIARYNDLTECIVEQYGEYYMVGPDGRKYHVNSRFTLGEDIADGGGLAQTYRAWSDRFASDPSGEKHDNYILPGLNYTREQLFFIQFARGWARNIKPAEAVRRIRTDEHSPTKFRVIGPLSNSEEFQKAFQCTKKSKMNRKNKCKIW